MQERISDSDIARAKDHAQKLGVVKLDTGIHWRSANITGRPKGSINYSIIQTSDLTSKIVFHIKDISKKDMESCSIILYGLVQQLNIENSMAEGGISPIFLHQWDFVLLDVPNFRVESICNYLIQQLQDMFRKT